jgi:hypothetical protein
MNAGGPPGPGSCPGSRVALTSRTAGHDQYRRQRFVAIGIVRAGADGAMPFAA